LKRFQITAAPSTPLKWGVNENHARLPEPAD
jgi:hypothetical protein